MEAGSTRDDPSNADSSRPHTLRLVDDAKEPPIGPMNLLRWIAKRIWQTRVAFDRR